MGACGGRERLKSLQCWQPVISVIYSRITQLQNTWFWCIFLLSPFLTHFSYKLSFLLSLPPSALSPLCSFPLFPVLYLDFLFPPLLFLPWTWIMRIFQFWAMISWASQHTLNLKFCSYSSCLSSKWTVIYFSPPPALFVAVQDNSLYLAVRKATGCAVLWLGLGSCSHPLWLQHVEISSSIYRLWAHPKGIKLSPCFIPILSRISLVCIIYSSLAECQCAGPACLCFFLPVLMKVCAAAIYVSGGGKCVASRKFREQHFQYVCEVVG